MRKLTAVLLALVLTVTLALGVSAATGASGLSSFATVSADGSCQVTLALTLHIEQAVDKLYFPIPGEAASVTLNGSRVSTSKDEQTRRINLAKVLNGVVGDVSVSVGYSLHDVIGTTEAGTLQLELPLLSGFAYTVEKLDFSVTLPGQIETLPAFSSGYHQARIEEDISYSVEGSVITGSSLKALKDHETLTMTLVVSEQMFPQSIAQTQDYSMGAVAMGICAGLALLYWLIAMCNLPVWRQERTEPPQGFNAGQLGCILAGQGVDLSLMVLSWAQLGYILIQVDRHQRVLLHKRMDMGNERSEFEQRCFKKLFGRRETVDTSGYAYAQLTLLAAKKPAGVQELMHRRTGNPRVFRVLAAGIGLFGGASLAVALAAGAALQGFLIFLLGLAGAVSGWCIQGVGVGLLLRDRRKLLTGLVLSGVWLVLSLFAGAPGLGIWMVLGLVLAGVLFAWGGRRTELGRLTLSQTLGLRKYLRTVDKKRLKELCETDPDYFFRLAPYAMALGVDRAFARRFGKQRLDGCPYLTTGMDPHMTAGQWNALLRRTVDAMNDRAGKLNLEKFLGMLQRITKV